MKKKKNNNTIKQIGFEQIGAKVVGASEQQAASASSIESKKPSTNVKDFSKYFALINSEIPKSVNKKQIIFQNAWSSKNKDKIFCFSNDKTICACENNC